MYLDVNKQFKTNEFLQKIKIRYLVGEQNIFLIVGDTNSGKTIFGVLLYYLIKKGILKQKISIDNTKIYFDIKELGKDITKLKNEIIFYDEAGRDLDIGTWNSVMNKTLRHILQTQRIRKNFYFIIVPHKRFITQVSLPLFNYLLVIHKKILYSTKTNKIVQNRLINVYNIITTHFNVGSFMDYFHYKLLGKYSIPNINEIQNKDFKKLLELFRDIEIEKKEKIAKEIEEEIRAEELKDRVSREKIIVQKRKLDVNRMKIERDRLRYMKDIKKYEKELDR